MMWDSQLRGASQLLIDVDRRPSSSFFYKAGACTDDLLEFVW